jgi:hypothetical protein
MHLYIGGKYASAEGEERMGRGHQLMSFEGET